MCIGYNKKRVTYTRVLKNPHFKIRLIKWVLIGSGFWFKLILKQEI